MKILGQFYFLWKVKYTLNYSTNTVIQEEREFLLQDSTLQGTLPVVVKHLNNFKNNGENPNIVSVEKMELITGAEMILPNYF